MTNPNPIGTSTDAGGIGGLAGPIGMAGALLTPFAGIYDSYQQQKTSRRNTDRTIAANKAEAELAYQRQVQMWHMQNAYNDPQSQMERFKSAGLNPHLIYGQGNAGNANSMPQYQPPHMQYQYAAPKYGQAFESIIPMLMSVGTWMQNMRLTESELRSKQVAQTRGTTETERAQQMIDYLAQMNPKLLEGAQNKLTLFPYQKDMQRWQAQKGYLGIADLEQDYRYKYGDELFRELRFDAKTPGNSQQLGGVRRLQFLQEQSKTKIADAKASWTDFNITDPQAIMTMVLQGVLGLAGQAMRMPRGQSLNRKSRKVTHELENRMPGGRVQIRRRSYDQ